MRTNVYVFTSPNDALLKLGMPVLGTSDREFVEAHVAGLEGFVAARNEATTESFGKITEVPWRPEWISLGILEVTPIARVRPS